VPTRSCVVAVTIVSIIPALVAANPAEPLDLRSVGSDPSLLTSFRDLVLMAASSGSDQEAAAFLVREADGIVRCVPWPRRAGFRTERYRGVLPDGTVAIAHTHPHGWERPSSGDVEEARRIGLPIFVLSRWHIYAVDPATGRSVVVIEKKNWSRTSQER
jgi:proteasome lid subunit RPN8/RPN11